MTQPPQGPWHQDPDHRPAAGQWGQQGAPPQWPQPHGQASGRRPRPPGPVLAICLGVVATLVLSVVVVVSLLRSDQDQVAGTGYGDYPKATAPPPAETSTTHTTSAAALSSSVMERPAPGSRTPTGAPGPRKVYQLADHPILQNPDAGLKNRVCNLPQWRSDPASAQDFFTAAGQCLDAAWGPFLEHYNLPFTSPDLHFPSGPSFQTACGTIEVGIATAAYYCENNLYVPFAGLQTDQYGDSAGVYLALFAHEYGHHVQEVSGIMDAAWEKIYAAGPDSLDGLEMSRRKELQAQCFSGMFLGAHVGRGGTITRDMYNQAWDDQETRGDDTSGTRDHGSNAHYAAWWRAGAKDNRIVDCNTFTAAGADVS